MGSEKMSGKIGFIVLVFLSLSADFLPCFSAAKQQPPTKKPHRIGTSAVFPVQGNVYPLGYYSVSLKIGNPPKVFELDIDSGSDLTWVQCDAPCTGCTKPRESLYKPKNNALQCGHPICSSIHSEVKNQPCHSPTEQCDYEIEYADHGSSLGVLVSDYFPLKFANGSQLGPRLAFGCGYDQRYNGHGTPPPTAGVLGLGNGKAGILSQLTQLGITRNVVGHCFSTRGGGFLFFGDDFVPRKGITWIPISGPSEKHYLSGPAELYFGGKPAGLKGFDVIFDSGSSYTYFNSQAYGAVVNLVKKGLSGKPLKEATDDQSLPICWKGNKPFKSVEDAKSFFTPLALSFTNVKNAQLQLPPEAYLIVSKHGNACLGILNGSEVGLGKFNIIGDISLQEKLVIYDNEKQQIGWGPENCHKLHNMEGEYDEDFLQPHAVNFGIATEHTAHVFEEQVGSRGKIQPKRQIKRKIESL